MPNCSRACAPPRARSNFSKWCRRTRRARASSGISILRRSRPRPCRWPHALTRVLAHDVVAAVDAPPFDRSNVDGFALRAVDTVGAGDAAPKVFRLNAEVIACGDAPVLDVKPGTATAIATGGVIPRGADAVVMIEHTELIEQGAPRDRAAPRRRARAIRVLRRLRHRARRDAAAARHAHRLARDRHAGGLRPRQVDVVRRPKVAVLSTGDELVAPGSPLKPAGVYDSNGAIIAAAVAEAGGEPLAMGAFPDDAAVLEKAVRQALAASDLVVLSGGTSKGAGDLSHAIVSRLGKPGILVHGVALKPGKPLCLGVIGDKPIVVLPGFPTSAIFTFHAFVAPVIRARAGLPPEAAQTLSARVPVRVASELGRKEFVLVSLIDSDGRPDRVPDRQRLRLGDQLFAGRRLSRDRRAGFRARCRQQRASDPDRQRRARARSGHHGQPRRGARCGGGCAGRARLFRTHAGRRQSGRRGGGQPRRMRYRAGASDRSGKRPL